MNNNFKEIVEFIWAGVDRLPDPPREKLKRELTLIKELLMDSRAPRIVVVGRRGAGKSSLINAIFQDQVAKVGAVLSETGQAQWHDFKNEKGGIRILDTRGLGDRSRPETANFETSLEEIKAEIVKECPDAVLFLCKAKEVDAHIAEDIRQLVQIKNFVKTTHDYELPLMAAVTQVDELDPKRVEAPFDHPQKQAHIQAAVRAIHEACREAGVESVKTLPVCAYAEFEDGVQTYASYWNIDALVEFLMEALPRCAQLQLARLSKLRAVQMKFARSLVGATATLCAGIAAVPIPVADIIPITAAQIAMLSGIGYLSGREVSKDSAKEFIVALGANIGVGLAWREAARALAKVVFPGAGSAVSAGVAFAGTWAIGEAAMAYFIDGKSIEESRAVFERTKKKKEAE